MEPVRILDLEVLQFVIVHQLKDGLEHIVISLQLIHVYQENVEIMEFVLQIHLKHLDLNDVFVLLDGVVLNVTKNHLNVEENVKMEDYVMHLLLFKLQVQEHKPIHVSVQHHGSECFANGTNLNGMLHHLHLLEFLSSSLLLLFLLFLISLHQNPSV